MEKTGINSNFKPFFLYTLNRCSSPVNTYSGVIQLFYNEFLFFHMYPKKFIRQNGVTGLAGNMHKISKPIHICSVIPQYRRRRIEIFLKDPVEVWCAFLKSRLNVAKLLWAICRACLLIYPVLMIDDAILFLNSYIPEVGFPGII